MVIHHDKLAYGKLASEKEDLSEQQILAMLEKLNAEEAEKEQNENSSQNKNKENG